MSTSSATTTRTRHKHKQHMKTMRKTTQGSNPSDSLKQCSVTNHSSVLQHTISASRSLPAQGALHFCPCHKRQKSAYRCQNGKKIWRWPMSTSAYLRTNKRDRHKRSQRQTMAHSAWWPCFPTIWAANDALFLVPKSWTQRPKKHDSPLECCFMDTIRMTHHPHTISLQSSGF